MLLGLWIRVFGDGEAATHALSLVFSLASIPLAYLAGRSIFDRRTGFVCALLVASTPYLTYYAQETRMYTFEAFLSLVAALAYVNGIVRGRRAWAVLLVPTLALMVYVHNWALFFCVALALATVLYARERLRLFGLVAVGVAVLYLPWLPTLLSQAKHTGAPWSTRPSFHELFTAPGAVLGGDAPFIAFVVAAAAGFTLRAGRSRAAARDARRSDGPARLAVVADLAGLDDALLRRRPRAGRPARGGARHARRPRRDGRARRRPLPLVGLQRQGRQGEREADRRPARAVRPPGELVVSTHPEQVPVLRYYLGGGLRWATTLGPVRDSAGLRLARRRLAAEGGAAPRDARPAARLGARAGTSSSSSSRSSATTEPGRPSGRTSSGNGRCEWSALLQRDPRVRLEHHFVTDEIAVKQNYFKPVQAFVYRRVG